MRNDLTPPEIVSELDNYVIGQRDAKRTVAIALRNRWRRQQAPPEIQEEILPSNIILIGPTGVGKTEIARRLARLAGAPFIKVEATKFTEVGYVGRDVESMIRDLADRAVNIVREEFEGEVHQRAREHANERILDILLPRPPQPPDYQVGDELPESPSRKSFRERLNKGALDEREVDIEVSSDQSPMLQVFGPMGLEEMGMNLQDMLGNIGGHKRRKRRLPVREARELLTKEEAGKLIDMDRVTREAIRRVEESGIVFIDEIDKVVSRSTHGSHGADVSREGVQRDLLPIVEGATVTTKYGMVRTDHILFMASGAFHLSKPSDFIPELQGRFPIRVELRSLTEEDFYLILTQPRNALLKQYQALLMAEGVTLTFTDEAVRAIARCAAQVNADVENIGARRLHTIMTTLLDDLLFEAGTSDVRAVNMDADAIDSKLSAIVEDRDLSQYIL